MRKSWTRCGSRWARRAHAVNGIVTVASTSRSAYSHRGTDPVRDQRQRSCQHRRSRCRSNRHRRARRAGTNGSTMGVDDSPLEPLPAGVGLAIIRELVNDLDVEVTAEGCAVRAELAADGVPCLRRGWGRQRLGDIAASCVDSPKPTTNDPIWVRSAFDVVDDSVRTVRTVRSGCRGTPLSYPSVPTLDLSWQARPRPTSRRTSHVRGRACPEQQWGCPVGGESAYVVVVAVIALVALAMARVSSVTRCSPRTRAPHACSPSAVPSRRAPRPTEPTVPHLAVFVVLVLGLLLRCPATPDPNRSLHLLRRRCDVLREHRLSRHVACHQGKHARRRRGQRCRP